MLRELIDRLFTSCPRPVRAMGYLREAVGIRRRYRRCRDDWQGHIEHCRTLIRRGMERCSRRRTAAILGAGLLHDVPLDDLAGAFDTVLLVDIVHPFTNRLKRLPANVRRVTLEVTNTVTDLYRVSDEPDRPLPESRPDFLCDVADLDFTVSLNLLSQLPCMPLEYLEKWRAHPVTRMEDYARNLIAAHARHLETLPGVVTLITDVERLKIDMLRRVVERRDLMFGLELPAPDAEWQWRLAPCPEADPRHDFFRKVIGYVDWKSALQSNAIGSGDPKPTTR